MVSLLKNKASHGSLYPLHILESNALCHFWYSVINYENSVIKKNNLIDFCHLAGNENQKIE